MELEGNQVYDCEKAVSPQRNVPSSRWRVVAKILRIVQTLMALIVISHQLGVDLASPLLRFINDNGRVIKFPRPADNEAFEFHLPIVHPNLVYEHKILEHTFGNSWGVPATESFYPPIDHKDFNRVVLGLKTEVDGVQYDRLAHVFINDIPVWRTSTAEPGNKLVFSSVNKDVSKYLSLFKKRDPKVTLQLDNLMKGKLNGAFNTTLTAKYYNVPEQPKDLFHHFTTTSKPAERVTKLIKSKPNRTPLLYYPSDIMDFAIPKLPRNTTALKLSLYVSGNAAEEFWYSNVIESEKNIFSDHDHHFLGHGPVRVVNTYINNVLVSVNAPEPVIFTGGVSPALWRPIVGVNSFDIKPLEIDLTAYLPELWENGLSLDVEITNGTKGGVVGSNWIIAASLLSWESGDIETSFGKVESYTNSSDIQIFHATTDEDKFFEVVKSSHSSDISSNMTYVLKNGTELPLKVHCSSNVKFSNGQQYYSYGDAQFLTSGISSIHHSQIELEGKTVGSVMSAHVYPLAISILTEPISPPNITYETNVTNVYGSRIVLGEREVFALESRQNGTSTYTLSPTGNFGFGTTEHVFGAELYSPFPSIKGGAFAKAVNGTLVEFDERYRFEDDESTMILSNDLPIMEHINEMVKLGLLSVSTARDFAIQCEDFKKTIESKAEDISMQQNGAHYKSKFPGLRANLE